MRDALAEGHHILEVLVGSTSKAEAGLAFRFPTSLLQGGNHGFTATATRLRAKQLTSPFLDAALQPGR